MNEDESGDAPSPRSVTHAYEDVLDTMWRAVAGRVGLRIRRSDDAYASTDGRGELVIGTAAILDADDCLAQIIFHELCHHLVEGLDGARQPDWGLDNESDRDLVREHACLRVQAFLADRHGLRWFLAPTTDHRAHYDRLGANPLSPVDHPSLILARRGLALADRPPFSPHLERALAATAQILAIVAATAAPLPRSDVTGAPATGVRPGPVPARADAPNAANGKDAAARSAPALPLLLDRLQPPRARHPSGLFMGLGTEGSCRECGFAAGRDEPGNVGSDWDGVPGASYICRKAADAAVPADAPGCDRWEPAPDCHACTACCREGFDVVEVEPDEAIVHAHPELIVVSQGRLTLPRSDGRCAALATDGACGVYGSRPRSCQEFAVSSTHCLLARRRVGMSI